jgi:hypothetical protein
MGEVDNERSRRRTGKGEGGEKASGWIKNRSRFWRVVSLGWRYLVVFDEDGRCRLFVHEV